MPPLVIDVARTDDHRDVVHRAVQALVEGQLIALPTETVYGLAASATNAKAVARMAEAKGRGENAPFALAIKSADDAEDYFPQMSPLARRLARRCWPGPVTMVLDADHQEGLSSRLPAETHQYLCPEGTIGLRAPANQILQDVLRMLAGPIALTSVNRTGEPSATTAEECVSALGDDLALVLDDGPSRYGQASSVIRINGNRFEMLREGVVGKPTLDRLSNMLIVFVCTGNTCRSPLAEGIMKQHLAKAIGIEIDALEEHGVMVASAGLAAPQGHPASESTAALLQERGIDLTQHSAQQLSDHLVRQADWIIPMTRQHLKTIIDFWPEVGPRTRLLSPNGRDLSDPIGGPIDVYRDCAEQIDAGIAHHAKEILRELGV